MACHRIDHAGLEHVGPGLIGVGSPSGHLIERPLAGRAVGGGQALGVLVGVSSDVVDGQLPPQFGMASQSINADVAPQHSGQRRP